jgi:AcrR family transcriptional regulator
VTTQFLSGEDGESSEELRARLVYAFSRAAGERGYSKLDIDLVCRYAGVSTERFREQFETIEQALVAAHEAFLQRLWLDLVGACEAGGEWPDRVRAGVGALVGSLSEASAAARVFAIEAPGISFVAAERQFAALDRLAALLRDGRSLYPQAAELPEVTERALIGGVVSIVCEHLLAEDPKAIPALRRQLVEILLTPYLGFEQARAVAGG